MSSYDRVGPAAAVDGWAASPLTGARRHAVLTDAAHSLEVGDLDGALDRVEFAHALDPSDLELQLAAANLWFRCGQLAAAADRYDEVLRRAPDHHDARLLHAVTATLLGDASAARKDWDHLAAQAPIYARHWKSVLRHALANQSMTPSRDLSKREWRERHGIVVLGRELNPDGTMTAELTDRLAIVAQVARNEPDALVIVSGGMIRGGAVEAPLMRGWLIRAGVDEHRILLERNSIDTLENATLSTSVAIRARIKSLTLVTSAYHMARAGALFDAVRELSVGSVSEAPVLVRRLSAGLPTDADPHGDLDVPHELLIRRDLLRLGGLWTIPGYVR